MDSWSSWLRYSSGLGSPWLENMSKFPGKCHSQMVVVSNQINEAMLAIESEDIKIFIKNQLLGSDATRQYFCFWHTTLWS